MLRDSRHFHCRGVRRRAPTFPTHNMRSICRTVFIEAEKYSLNSNENYEAKVYFAAYNTQLEKSSDIYVNGEKLEIKNGIGFLSLKPSNKGKETLQFVVKTKNESSIEDWKTEKTVEYILK